jgi:hypothetical protein
MIGFFQWLTESPLARALAASESVFVAIQSLHFIGFAFLIGTIAIVDLRLLNLVVPDRKPADLATDLKPWTWVGLGMMLTTGPLMFSTSATAYHYNASFRFKMVCLTLALMYHFTLHRRAIRSDMSPVASKLAGAASLLLWSAVVFAGRMIAFV